MHQPVNAINHWHFASAYRFVTHATLISFFPRTQDELAATHFLGHFYVFALRLLRDIRVRSLTALYLYEIPCAFKLGIRKPTAHCVENASASWRLGKSEVVPVKQIVGRNRV